jgi:hypothetical protein
MGETYLLDTAPILRSPTTIYKQPLISYLFPRVAAGPPGPQPALALCVMHV